MTSRVKAIATHTMEDFNNHGHFFKESNEDSVKWLTHELMSVKGIEDLSVVEISLLVLKKLNSLDLLNLEMITEIIADK